jgi:uncharacterized repeat protein (TIGR03803 family)
MKRPGLFVLMSLLLVCWGKNVSGRTLTPLWEFGGLSNDADGGSPGASMIQGRDGNFYGTSGLTNQVHCTVFKITPDGTLTTLWQFGSLSNSADGTSLMSGLVQGRDGDFYGTTASGGTNHYAGTAYKITSAGTLTPLWQFGSLSNNTDGHGPNGLIQGSDGNFYGTTAGGGAFGHGTVFRITPQGSLTTLYSFGNFAGDGVDPFATVVQGSDGNFYGTTAGGGAFGHGTVFQITPAGTLTNIWHFTGGMDGALSQAALVQGRDGLFYGTTYSGGSNNVGTIYKITSTGTLTPLWQFDSLSNHADGGRPSAALVLGSGGNFYGTTSDGGTNQSSPVFPGTVFRITSAGTLTPLWQFGSLPNLADGFAPHGGLVQGSDGAFYGTTTFGGTNNNNNTSIYGTGGTIFKICVQLNPPANQISSLSPANSDIVVAVPSVAGETYQLQYRADLTAGDWSNIPDACVSNSLGALLTVTNFGGALAPQGFYRFDITP